MTGYNGNMRERKNKWVLLTAGESDSKLTFLPHVSKSLDAGGENNAANEANGLEPKVNLYLTITWSSVMFVTKWIHDYKRIS